MIFFLHIFSFFDIDINISLNKLNEKKHQNVLLIQINKIDKNFHFIISFEEL